MCIQNVFRNCIVITFNQCFSRFSNTIVVIEKLEHYYFVLLFFLNYFFQFLYYYFSITFSLIIIQALMPSVH